MRYPEQRGKHGMSASPIFFAWSAMVQRCGNPKNDSFSRYGGRGIFVCDRWKKFENFLADMGERPPGKTLGRIDNDGPYSPDNCRWETPQQQGRNMRRNRKITALGRTMLLCDWALETGLRPSSILSRISRGYTADEAVSVPKFARPASLARSKKEAA